MIVSPYSSKISVFLPPQAVQTNTQSTANTRRANFFMIGFCGGNFFWKKSLPRTPFQKLYTIYPGFGVCFFGFCEGNFFGKKSPSRSLPKTFILYSIGLDSADRTCIYSTQCIPFPKNYIPQSLPVEGGSQREPLANDLLRTWTEPHWCAIGLAQTPPISIPPYKSFAGAGTNKFVLKSDRSPRSPKTISRNRSP